MTNGLDGRRIGFVGGGGMAEALVGGILAAGLPPTHVIVAEPVPERRQLLASRFGIRVTERNAEVLLQSDVVVIAVKPGFVAAAISLACAEAGARAVDPLWISIAAGVPLHALEAALPTASRVIRAMPNTPALVRSGITAFAPGVGCDEADRALARALFETVGAVWETHTEALLDAVTGVSGSGPAYVFVFLEALSDAGVRVGLPRDAASLLACHTVLGAAKLALESGRHPAELKDQVTSPGGTTIAGLERLEAGGLRAALYAAVAAATARARELGGG